MGKGKPITQDEWIHNFYDKYRPKFNEELFVRDNYEIIEAVSKIIRSCEKDKYFTLKVLSIDVIMDYEEIYNTLRAYQESQKKKNSKDPNQYDYIQIKDSDIMLLKVTYFIQKNGIERMKIDGVDMDVENPNQTLEVLIELPRFVERYYFRLQGNYYIPINQIVDGSTYNNSTTNSSKYDNVTLKTSFMSVRIYRMFKPLVDVNTKEKIKCIIYTSLIFKNHINAMYYIFAKFALNATLEWFHAEFIQISDQQDTRPDRYCFKKHNLYISVPRVLMDEEPVVQSLVATISDGIGKNTTLLDIYRWDYWLQVLGASFKSDTVDKGIFVLDSLESIYDQITKETIRLPEEKKKDIYNVLKWLICEFSNLRSKDNVDVSIKRRRLAEYIAQIYAMKLTKGIHRISDLGKKVKLKQIVSAIRTKPDYVISRVILMSNLVSYVDLVNDNDAIQVLKYSYKGIAGLGEDGVKVQPIYRFVDPSHVGILDLDTSSVSDPGMSGMLCPSVQLYDNFFTKFEEPNSWDADYTKRLKGYYKEHKMKNPIIMHGDPDPFDYEYIKEENIRISLGDDRKDVGTTIEGNGSDQIGETKSLFEIKIQEEKPEDIGSNEFVYQPYVVKDDDTVV